MNAVKTADSEEARQEWQQVVQEFCEQVARWAAEDQWGVAWKSLERTEEPLGTYEVPMLIIQAGRRAIMVEPVAREIMGAAGRIDLYAYPTLFRVMLLRSCETGEWLIRTDSGIFLKLPWNKQTFVSLIADLTGAG